MAHDPNSTQGDDSQNFWAGAVEKPSKSSPQGAAQTPSGMLRRRKILLIAGGVIVLLVLVGMLAALPIAGSMAPGIIENAASKSIAGKVKVHSASLSWGGPQIIGPIDLFSPDGKEVGHVEVRSSAGAWGLVLGYLGGDLNVGQVDVSGNASIVRDASGQTNLEEAVAPRPGTSIEPPKKGAADEPGTIKLGSLPPIKARISVKDVDITYTDAAATPAPASYVIRGFTADADVDLNRSGAAATLELSSKIGPSSAPTGNVAVSGKLTLPAVGGVARYTDASINAKVSITDAPVDVLDALALQKGRLVKALGPSARVDLDVNGDMTNAVASVVADSSGAKADLAFKIKDGTVTASRPGSLTIKGESLRALVPAVDQTLAGQKLVSIQQLPDIAANLSALSLKIPRDASRIDLRGTSVELTLQTGAVAGILALNPAEKASAFTIAPATLHVTSSDLASAANIKLATTATVDGKPGGDIKVDLTGSNLLDSSGAIAPASAAIQGSVELDHVSTAIAQPFVSAMKIDLPHDVGPELNVRLTANAAAPAGGQAAPTAVDADIQSQNVRVKAALELAGGTLRTRQDGITAAIATAGGMASRFIDPSTGYSLAPTGQANIRVRSLTLPLPKDGRPLDLGALTADFDATVGGMSLAKIPAAGAKSAAPIEVQTLTATGKIGAGATPSITVKGDFSHDRAPFTLNAAMELKGLLATAGGKTELTPKNVRPQGSIELKNVPTALASMFVSGAAASPAAPEPTPAPAPGQPAPRPPSGEKPSPTPQAQPTSTTLAKTAAPMDIAALLKGAVGQVATVRIDSTPRGEALDLTATVSAQNFAAEVSAGLEDRLLDLRKANVVSTVAPDTVTSVVAAILPDMAEPPRLLQTTRATMQVAPIKIPLTESIFGGFKPDVANAPDATVTVSLPERTLVQGLAIKNQDGTRRDLGSVGVEAFQLKATVPPALFAGTSARWSKQASASMQGRILSGPDEVLTTLSGDLTATLSAAGDTSKPPLDRLNASMKLSDVSVGAVERLMAQDRGAFSGAVGDSAGVGLNVALTTPPGARTLADSNVDLDATVDTPRLKIPEPVKLRMLPDRFAIATPVKLAWEIDPRWASKFLEPPPPKPGEAPSQNASSKSPPRFTKPIAVRANVSDLAIGRGAAGPLKQGIFVLNATADVPAVEMQASDGSTIALEPTSLVIQSKAAGQGQGDAIDMNVRIAGATVTRQGAAPARAENMALTVSLSKLADPSGAVNTQTATVDARGDLPVIPVPLIDVLAQQDGLLTEALGPVAEAKVRANQLSRSGGTLNLEAKSARASASIIGAIQQDVFVTTQPLNVTISEISPELTKRLLKGVPLIGAIEKTPQDQPATVVGSDLKVPLGNDFSKLNGQVVVDPGEASFAAGGDFAKILKALKQKEGGKAGRRLEPLKVDIASGIATYQRWTLPIGEFQVKTEGSVNLVNRTLDVITWLPLGSLTEEAAGLFKSGDGLSKLFGDKDGGLGEATMVPWRTRGTFENSKTQPDLELFASEVVKSLKPEDLIKKGLQDLLKRKGGGGK